MTNRRKYWTALLCIALLGAAHGCKNAHNWNHPPPDLIPANCDLDGGYMTGTPPSAPSVICEDLIDRDAGAHGVADDDLPCRCRQWEQTNQYLPQTIPTDLVPIHPPDAGAAVCGVDNPKCYGCKGDELLFVWPDCCTVAGAIGTIVTNPHVAHDEDYNFNLCTMQGSIYIPRTSISRELRTSDSYEVTSTLPNLHVEVQECRLFDGTHTFSLPDDLPGDPPHVLEARPLPGDLVSVAGDWVDDRGHGSEKPYWTEIHEARALAVTRRIDDYTSVATMSFHFAYGGTQQDIVDLRIPALPSPDPVLFDKLNCALVPAVEDPDCGPPAGAVIIDEVPNPGDGPPYCRVTFKRDPNFDTQMDTNECHYKCNGETFQERFAEHGCNHVYTAVVRMWWTDPGDLWLCRSCACADPATNDTTFITAPVQGCARLGLDPTDPADQALACQDVCGGEMCGASAGCDIGECQPPPAGGVAELVARQVCDPTKQPFTHVAEAGDYRVVLDPTESFVTLVCGDGVVEEPEVCDDGNQQGGDGCAADCAALDPCAECLLVTALDVGVGHACVVRDDQTVRCFGANEYGQTGDPLEPRTVSQPTVVEGLGSPVGVATGDSHSCAVLADGSVWCWGSDRYGQLGDGLAGVDTWSATPVAAAGVADASGIAAGAQHTCALLGDGTVRCWGNNTYGQLGDGTTSRAATAVAVVGVSDAVEIQAGGQHSCARLRDGTVSCWGLNGYGQLGDGTLQSRSLAAPVQGLSTAVALAAGSDHTCAALQDGQVSCWGANDKGQIGQGTWWGREPLPLPVPGVEGAIGVAAGLSHSCALLAQGWVQCWGRNNYCQVGDGSCGNLRVDAVAASVQMAAKLGAGGYASCAALLDGTLQCWGLRLDEYQPGWGGPQEIAW